MQGSGTLQRADHHIDCHVECTSVACQSVGTVLGVRDVGLCACEIISDLGEDVHRCQGRAEHVRPILHRGHQIEYLLDLIVDVSDLRIAVRFADMVGVAEQTTIGAFFEYTGRCAYAGALIQGVGGATATGRDCCAADLQSVSGAVVVF